MNTGVHLPRLNDLNSISSTHQANDSLAASQHAPVGSSLSSCGSHWNSDIWGTARIGSRLNGGAAQAPRQQTSWSLGQLPTGPPQSQPGGSTASPSDSQDFFLFRNELDPWTRRSSQWPAGGLGRPVLPSQRRASALPEDSWRSNGGQDATQRLPGTAASRAVGGNVPRLQTRVETATTCGRRPSALHQDQQQVIGANGHLMARNGFGRHIDSPGQNTARPSPFRDLADSAISFSPTDERRDPLQIGGVGPLREGQLRNAKLLHSSHGSDRTLSRPGLDARFPVQSKLQRFFSPPALNESQEARRSQQEFAPSLSSPEPPQSYLPSTFSRLGISNSVDNTLGAGPQPMAHRYQSESMLSQGLTRSMSGDRSMDNGFHLPISSFSNSGWSGTSADALVSAHRSYSERDGALDTHRLRPTVPLAPNGGDVRGVYHDDVVFRNEGLAPGGQQGSYSAASDAIGPVHINGHLTYAEKIHILQEQRNELLRQMAATQMPGQFAQQLPYGYAPMADAQYLLPPQPVMQPRQMQECEPGQSFRSKALEDFRSNAKSNRRYELKDFYGHLVEFSGDREGSKFIQTKLEQANSEEKDRVFCEILPNALPIMTDIFGNYVIQKFFEYGDQNQKRILANKMRGQVFNLSTQIYGCRVVQTALEHVLVDQQIALIKELQGYRDGHNLVIRCVKDQNGNHVIQRAIERVPQEHIRFIIDAFIGQIQHLATHDYGCRVVQRLLEHCEEPTNSDIMQELFACASTLISDKFGNYVTQHVIEHGKQEDRNRLIAMVMKHLVPYSRQKCASNVVESCIKFGSDEQRHTIMLQIAERTPNVESGLSLLIKDPYANYVIQKLLDYLNPADHKIFSDMLRPEVAKCRRLSPNKQVEMIATKLERFDLPVLYRNSSDVMIHGKCASYSPAHTPALTTDSAQSPTSSTGPSMASNTGNSAYGYDTVTGAQDPGVKLERED